jgi:hypothetical protein
MVSDAPSVKGRFCCRQTTVAARHIGKRFRNIAVSRMRLLRAGRKALAALRVAGGMPLEASGLHLEAHSEWAQQFRRSLVLTTWTCYPSGQSYGASARASPLDHRVYSKAVQQMQQTQAGRDAWRIIPECKGSDLPLT